VDFTLETEFPSEDFYGFSGFIRLNLGNTISYQLFHRAWRVTSTYSLFFERIHPSMPELSQKCEN
jgi:hypothetical protein